MSCLKCNSNIDGFTGRIKQGVSHITPSRELGILGPCSSWNKSGTEQKSVRLGGTGLIHASNVSLATKETPSGIQKTNAAFQATNLGSYR